MITISRSVYALLMLSICLPGCRKKAQEYPQKSFVSPHQPNSAATFTDDDVLEMDLPTIEKALFDDQLQQDLGITIFAEQVSQADEETRTFFKPLYFEYDQYVLKPGQSAALEHNTAQAKKLIADGYTIVLEGHACTSGGSESYNMQLSERRAQAIKEQFIRAGLPASKISLVGRGTSQCLVMHGSREEQAPNRRVEIVGINKK